MVDAGDEHGVARRSVVERSRRVALRRLEGVGHHHERGARDRAGFATTRSTTERLATPAVDATLGSMAVRSALVLSESLRLVCQILDGLTPTRRSTFPVCKHVVEQHAAMTVRAIEGNLSTIEKPHQERA
jgi:hypothetical protein